MLVNLTEVLTKEGKVKSECYPVKMENFAYDGADYPILEKTEASITFTNVERHKAIISGNADITLAMLCDRCLKEVEVPFQLSFEHEIAGEQESQYSFVNDGILDTEELIHHEIVVNLPMKVLCKDDCKGICTQCGNDRNEMPCGCDTFVPDPRMAAIKDIFNAGNKEV